VEPAWKTQLNAMSANTMNATSSASAEPAWKAAADAIAAKLAGKAAGGDSGAGAPSSGGAGLGFSSSPAPSAGGGAGGMSFAEKMMKKMGWSEVGSHTSSQITKTLAYPDVCALFLPLNCCQDEERRMDRVLLLVIRRASVLKNVLFSGGHFRTVLTSYALVDYRGMGWAETNKASLKHWKQRRQVRSDLQSCSLLL
jgi:hypothetical protein